MKRLLLLSACLALCLASANVQALILPQKPQVETLGNGLTVVTVPWDSPGMVSYFSLVRTGSRDEVDRNHTGFAHLFEHMMFRGTRRMPKKKYEAKIQEFGADNNAFTWLDLTCFTITVPREVLPELIEIEADRFRKLHYSEADFKTETGAVLGEYNMNASNPALIMEEKLLETAFERHTYGHTTMGYIADVKAMPGYYRYSRRFHRRFYTPDNTTLIVVGDFDRDALIKKIEDQYGSWKGKRRKTRAKIERPQKAPRSVHVDWSGPTAPKMTIAYKIPAFAPGPNSAALEVLAHLVFGESSPLYRKLVVEDRKVISMEASHGIFAPLTRDPFLFKVDIMLREGTTFDEVRDAVTAAVEKVTNGKIPDNRIDAVKSHARYYFELGLETPSDVAVALAMLISATGDPDSLEGFARSLSEVTPADVTDAAEKFLTEKRRTVVTLSTKEGGSK